MAGKEALTRTGRFLLDEELGIIRFWYNPGAMVTLADAKEGVEVARRLSRGKQYPFLVDLTSCKATTRDARDYMGGPATDALWCAVALVGGSPIGNMIGNIFLSVRKGTSPSKMFSSEDTAIAWLRGFMG